MWQVLFFFFFFGSYFYMPISQLGKLRHVHSQGASEVYGQAAGLQGGLMLHRYTLASSPRSLPSLMAAAITSQHLPPSAGRVVLYLHVSSHFIPGKGLLKCSYLGHRVSFLSLS